MKRLYILLIVLLAFGSDSFGQGKVVLGLQFQNLPAFSPAFTGANDFLDIRTGFRKQWAGFDGAPTTGFLSLYTPIRLKKNPYKANSLRSSTNAQYYKGGDTIIGSIGDTKLGIGGFVLVVDQGIMLFKVCLPFRKRNKKLARQCATSLGHIYMQC